MSRSQRILQCVADRAFPTLFDHVFQAVLAGEPERKGDVGSLRSAVSAQLQQLVLAKKLRRTGTPGAYLYHATKLTLVDLRKVDAEGNARDKTAKARPNAKRAPAKRTAPPPQQPAVKAAVARLVTIAVHKRDATKAVATPSPAPKRQAPETVEQFLARGGRIQHLRNGEVSRPLEHIGLHEQARRRKTAGKKRAKPTTTD